MSRVAIPLIRYFSTNEESREHIDRTQFIVDLPNGLTVRVAWSANCLCEQGKSVELSCWNTGNDTDFVEVWPQRPTGSTYFSKASLNGYARIGNVPEKDVFEYLCLAVTWRRSLDD